MTIPIDHKPDLAQALGRVAIHWSHLESSLWLLFRALTNLDQIPARVVMQEVRSVQVKLNILSNLLKTCCHEDVRDRFLPVINEIRQLSNTRNRYLHGMWMPADAGSGTLVKDSFPSHTLETIPIVQLNDLAQSLEETSHKLTRLLAPSPATTSRRSQ